MMKFGSLPVPWNASWSSEVSYELRPCRWADGKLAVWQPARQGAGRPIFAKPHFVRQRRSIAQFLCTVCGKHTPTNDRWWFGHGQFQDGWFMTMESPVHCECARLALTVCPHLKGRDEDLMRFPAGYRVIQSILGGEAFERDFNLKDPQGRPIIGGLKLGWPKSAVAFRTNAVATS